TPSEETVEVLSAQPSPIDGGHSLLTLVDPLVFDHRLGAAFRVIHDVLFVKDLRQDLMVPLRNLLTQGIAGTKELQIAVQKLIYDSLGPGSAPGAADPIATSLLADPQIDTATNTALLTVGSRVPVGATIDVVSAGGVHTSRVVLAAAQSGSDFLLTVT